MKQRGWTETQIEQARSGGERHPSVDLETGGPAARYIHPTTGRTVVYDNASGEVIHVGGDGFVY